MPAGRPSKYDPAFCDQVIALGKEGAGKAEMAAALDIDRSTFRDWSTGNNAEFSAAVKRALDCSQAWWERKGRIATFDGQGFNATSYIFNMKNRFSDDWRDKQDHEHSGSLVVQILKMSNGNDDPASR